MHRFRVFLITMAAGLATLGTTAAATNAAARFTHGVASGDVTSSSAIVWARLSGKATAQAEVYDNPDLKGTPVFSKKAQALASNDFVVQVDAKGLTPSTTYYYVWKAGSTASPTGKLKTAPDQGKSEDFCFTYSGDSDSYHPGGSQFKVLNAARQEQCDFFVYLGDTIYADSDESGAPPPAETLADYRNRYKLNRGIPNLPNLLADTPTYGIWDDHEVVNDFNRTVDPTLYKNGRQAFLNYVPMRTTGLPNDPTCVGQPLFRKFRYGADAEFIIPDQRSCRDVQVKYGIDTTCGTDIAPTLPVKQRRILRDRWLILVLLGLLPEKPDPACLQAIKNPKRTMLGPVQKQLFKQSLLDAEKSGVKYKFVISELAMQEFFALPYDRWEGYAAERQEILDFILKNKIDNVIFLTTDNHANLVNQVYLQRYPKKGKPVHVADELVTGPIATSTLREEIRSKLEDLVEPLEDALSLIGMECRDTNRYSYGVVQINSKDGKATVTLKDENGNPIYDTENSSKQCERSFSG